MPGRHTQRVHTGLRRADVAPPSSPRPLAPLAEHLGDHNASDEAEALQLPDIGELAAKVENNLGEPSLDAFIQMEDHPAAGAVNDRRSTRPEGGFGAFPQEDQGAI